MKRSLPRRDDYGGDAKRTRTSSDAATAAEDPNAPPVLLPFKRWLMTQDDAISDEDAVKK